MDLELFEVLIQGLTAVPLPFYFTLRPWCTGSSAVDLTFGHEPDSFFEYLLLCGRAGNEK